MERNFVEVFGDFSLPNSEKPRDWAKYNQPCIKSGKLMIKVAKLYIKAGELFIKAGKLWIRAGELWI